MLIVLRILVMELLYHLAGPMLQIIPEAYWHVLVMQDLMIVKMIWNMLGKSSEERKICAGRFYVKENENGSASANGIETEKEKGSEIEKEKGSGSESAGGNGKESWIGGRRKELSGNELHREYQGTEAVRYL